MRILCLLLTLIFSGTLSADTTVWSGEISANGTPSQQVPLDMNKTYVIEVSGTMNLGKWIQQGKKLDQDACYNFAEGIESTKLDSLKNNLNISPCQGTYRPDHIYTSKPFKPTQNSIHFWVDDYDYSDNSGSLHVKLIETP